MPETSGSDDSSGATCICLAAKKICTDVSGGQHVNSAEIETLAARAQERWSLCGECVDTTLTLCACLRAELEVSEVGVATGQTDIASCQELLQSLCQAVAILGSAARSRGLAQAELQRLLCLLEPPKRRLGAFAGWPGLWHAVLSTLRELAVLPSALSAGTVQEQPPPSPPHVQLRGGGLQSGTRAQDVQAAQTAAPEPESSEGRSPRKRAQVVASLRDTAETVRKQVFAEHGTTFCAWVCLHSLQVQGSSALLWRCWEPELGGWELRLREGESERSYIVVFIRLDALEHGGLVSTDASSHEGLSLSAEMEEVSIGSLRAECWLPIVIEIRNQSGAQLRLGGSAGQWVTVDMGLHVMRSKFPPPGNAAHGAEACKSLDRLAFFKNVSADMAALWIFNGVRGDEAARWLESLFAPDEGTRSYSRGCRLWSLAIDPPTWNGLEDQTIAKNNLIRLEADLLDRAVLGYLPGCKEEHELVNYCAAGGSSGSRDRAASQACGGQAALRVVDQNALDTSFAFMTQVTAPGWLNGLLWALARALPPHHSPSGNSGKQDDACFITEVVNAVFDFVASVVTSAGPRCRGMALQGCAHFFVEDGGFAVWSHVLRCHVSPAWMDSSTMQVLSKMLERIGEDQALARDSWAQLFGPHMASFWREAAPAVQQTLWRALFRRCSVERSHIGQLGGIEWLLFELSEHEHDLDVFCVKLLLALEERSVDVSSLLWARVLRFARAPAAHVRALLAVVRCLLLPGGSSDKLLANAPAAWVSEAVIALSTLCSHEDEGVRISALAALQQLEAETAQLSAEQLELLCTHFSRQNSGAQAEASDCSEHSYTALWAWLQCVPPPRLDWDEGAPLDVKVQRMRQIADFFFVGMRRASRVGVDVEPPAMVGMRSAGCGRLLSAVLVVLDSIGSDQLCLRFLLDYKLLLLIGWAGDCTSEWWDELKPHRSVWLIWLLNLLARKFDDDAYFLAAADLHTKIVSHALLLDSSAWAAVEDMIRWCQTQQQHQPAVAAAVCRTLLVQLFEALRGSIERLHDAERSFSHPFCANLIHMTNLLDDFLMPCSPLPPELPTGSAGSAAGAAQDPCPPCLRLFGVGNVIWLDFLVAAHLMRLWAAFVIRDPLQENDKKKTVLDFDLGSWMTARWGHRRRFPLDGVTEQVLFGSASQEDVGERFLFTRLMHWGTRCLKYRGPSDVDLCSHLGRPVTWRTRRSHSADKNGSPAGKNGGLGDRSPAAIAASAVSSEHVVQIRREILQTLRHLSLCLLAVGSHASRSLAPALAARPSNGTATHLPSGASAGPPVSGLREDLGVAIICFCAHASSFSSAARREAKSKSQEARSPRERHLERRHREEKSMTEEASKYASDVLLLLMLLCCQKWGRPAAGFSEQDLRACADAGEFPCTVLRLLPRLQWDKVAADLRDLLAKQPGPKAWLGATTPWGDPMATMQGSLFSFVFSPVNARRGGASHPSSGTSGEAAGTSGRTREREQPNVLHRWAFRDAVKTSPLAHAVWDPMEAPLVRSATTSANTSTKTPPASPIKEQEEEAVQAAPAISPANVTQLGDLPYMPEFETNTIGCDAATLSTAPQQSLQLSLGTLQKVVQRSNAQCRRLQRLRRGWTLKAWRAVCRTTRAPGSVWHSPETWVHSSPPAPRAGGIAAMMSDTQEQQPWSGYCKSWRRSFSGSTAATVWCCPGRHWSVGRLEASSHRRVVLRQCSDRDDVNDSDSGSLSDSSSSFSFSDSEGSSDFESSAVMQAECTWIRREGNHRCVLRLSQSILQLHIQPAQGTDQNGLTGDTAALHRGGRVRRFHLQDLCSEVGEGVHPRRFLHRDTALELHFKNGTAPVRLHFDDETPAPVPEAPALERARSAPTPASLPRDTGIRGQTSTFGAVGTDAFSLGIPMIPGGIGHGIGMASAAGTALLSKTTEFLGGKPVAEATTAEHRPRRLRQGVSADISLRDEVWMRITELQQKLQESAAVGEHPMSHVDRSIKDMCWFRSSGCASDRHVGAEREEVVHDALQPLKQADVKRVRRQWETAVDKRLNSLVLDWKHGELSNFGFLQSVNLLNGRSLEDLSQYPIFPWVLRDLRHQESPSMILERDIPEEVKAYFRDLSKTLGDLGCPERRSQLKEKYLQAADPENRPYHYGTHYSTPAFVMHFLIRVHPFTDLAQALQGGRFDVPDRIFYSLPESWRSCVTEMSDVRELTPELFSLPECLLNLTQLDFGVRQNGQRVDYVELPPWAQDAYHFVHEHRLALESKPVSGSLHQWIDLVWGYKQIGEAAVEALNVFFPLTYEDGVDWENTEPIMKHSKEQQILHFGQTPIQWLTTPAPARDATACSGTLLLPQGVPLRSWHSSAAIYITAGTSQRRVPSWGGSVVAIGAHAPQGDHTRLYIVQADGVFSCYRLRTSAPLLLQPQPANTAMSLALSLAVVEQGESAFQVDLESSFKLPKTEDGLRELMLQHDLANNSLAWSFLPEYRFFARGGYRDGSIVFGGPNHASLLMCAHTSAVSAVALSPECARYVPNANGLLLLSGALDGAVSVWAASDTRWRHFDCVGRWEAHLKAVRCVDFDDQSGLALSAGEDGLVQVYRLRPGMRPLRTFLFADRLPVTEARFGSRAPASVVACASSGSGGAAQSRICVWAFHGFLLATFDLPTHTLARGLRVWSDSDAREGVFYSTSDGHVELRSLPYLKPIWRRACCESMWPVAPDCAPAKRLAWVGHQDGSFEAILLSSLAGDA